MDHLQRGSERRDCKRSDQWRFLRRLFRTRRPLVLALCCMMFLMYLQQSTVEVFVQRDPEYSTPERRSLRELLHVQTREDEMEGSNLRNIAQEVQKVLKAVEEKIVTLKTQGETTWGNNQKPQMEEVARPAKDVAETSRSSKNDKKLELEAADEDEETDEKFSQLEEKAAAQAEPKDLPKGPVNVHAELDPEHQKEGVLSSPNQEAKEKVIESEPEEHLTLEETADSLPEIVHITFEEAVKDVKLAGWEDEWVAKAHYDAGKWGKLQEPKIDFVYLWVNGSEDAFQKTKKPYELNSVLNDDGGHWINSHGVNRYRDWDELRYSVRSVERHASTFRNKIQIIVNSVEGTVAGKQIPTWLNENDSTKQTVEVLAQEDFFDKEKHVCLPTFNSLTIENQLFNTPSDTDLMYALSDDMLLGKTHAASDIVSPLFGPIMAFKTNGYNTVSAPTEVDSRRFGEKPFLIYTSWLLNRRFGIRKRKGQSHFGHSLSRSVMREALASFPGPELQSACKRFRGEPGFQLYSWYAAFHYLIERHREALLWSFVMIRSDADNDGFLSWTERQELMNGLEKGMENEGKASFRKRSFYSVGRSLQNAGLEGPKVNTDILWTSLDGPAALLNLDCPEFDVNECLAPGFSISDSGSTIKNPAFSTAVIFERVARQRPACGDCLIKLILNQVRSGLSPLLPDPEKQVKEREIVVKSLMRYKYTITDTNSLFVMATDADQIANTLTYKYVLEKKELPGQICINDDVMTRDKQELQDLKYAMFEFYEGLLPEKSQFEI